MNNGLQTIDDNAFEGCTGIGSVSIPNTVTTIGDNAFTTCSNLTEVSIPPSVSTIGDRAFFGVGAGCELNINSNGGQISLGTLALPNSNYKVRLTGTGVPKKNVQDSIFDGDTNLTDVSITGSMTAISDFAFYGCTYLKNVELPSGIATIGQDAFCNCTRLETINIPATVTQIKDEAFKNAGQNAANTLEITFASNQNMTQCHLPDKDFKVVLEGGVPICGGVSIFDDEDTLKSVVFISGTSIPSQAFSDCAALTEVTFHTYPTIIGGSALPNNVGTITFVPSYPMLIGQSSPSNDVTNLFSGRNFSTDRLEIVFENNSTTTITIYAGAFNFTGADAIRYVFTGGPNNTNMQYLSGDCFMTTTSAEDEGGQLYSWDAANKTWH